jgi:TonB-dependent receptor
MYPIGQNRSRRMRAWLAATTLLSGLAMLALAPSAARAGTDGSDAPIATAAASSTTTAAAAGAADAPSTVQEVVVTGVRRSLTDEAASKRRNVDITDSIYAEDIGKFPDLNIGEALQRVPGIQLIRDIDGQGTQIQIRGLNANFTKILLNGSQIAVASDGTTDAGNSNREVDLDMFPTELYTSLTVHKTAMASLLEGGASGTVNMVNIRPFDNPSPGLHVAYSLQDGYGDSARQWSPRGSLIVSDTSADGKWGALLGVAGADGHYRTDGFETIGWTSANMTYPNSSSPQYPGCYNGTTAICDTIGGGGFKWATKAPAGTNIPGYPVGATLDQAALLALNPGLNLTQLSNALMPRLARDSYSAGTKDHFSTLLALEYRPADNLKFNFDGRWSMADRTFNRLDMDWVVRNSSAMVPIGLKVDKNGVVTSGTFANSQFFLEARPYHETVNFLNLNPSMDWKVNDWIDIQGQVDYNHSVFHRSAPSYLIQTPLGSGLTVNYSNTGGVVPSVDPSYSLDNPNLGWQWNAVRIQEAARTTIDKGTHWDATFGQGANNIKVGFAWDDTRRSITAYDDSSAAQNCVVSGNPTTVNGVVQPCLGAVPNSALAGYLLSGPASNYFSLASANPGYTSFIQPNYGTLNKATNLAYYLAHAPFASSSATATPSGIIEENNLGGYIELNGVTQWMDHDIRFNAGARYVHTDQTISGPSPVLGNAFQTLKHPYDAFLPSFNVSADLTDKLVLKLAGSRTITRPNPNVMLPGTTFSDPSAQVANQGNPNLQPYYSDNFDAGLEYYFGGSSKLGYVAVNPFYKSITGFTTNQQVTEPFSALGIPLSALSPVQLSTGITLNTPISVNTQVNIGQVETIKGIEFTWVQPLDFLINGAGVSANYTHVDVSPTGYATGIAPFSYNVGGWYEDHGVSVRLSWSYLDKRIVANAPQNNVNLPLVAEAYGQLDLSSSYSIPNISWLQLTFNALNLTNAHQRTDFGYTDAPYTAYFQGSQYILGVRGKF